MINKDKIDMMRTLNVPCVYDKLLNHPEIMANDNFYSLLTLFEPGVKERGVGFVEDICLQPDVSPQAKMVIMAFAGLFYEYTKKLDLEKDCGECEEISEETKELINDIKKEALCD